MVEGYVSIFCDTQTYTWGGKYYRHVKGLPIGPRATSAIAKVVMNMFDRRFRLSMDTLRLGMKLYVRYIDSLITKSDCPFYILFPFPFWT